jgi:hypothetical protein
MQEAKNGSVPRPINLYRQGIKDQILKTLTPCVVRWPKINW